MLGDGLAKGLALFGVGERHFGSACRHACAARSNINTAEFKTTGHLHKALTLFAADQIICAHAKVLKD